MTVSQEYKLIIAGGRDFAGYDLLSRVVYAMAEDVPVDRPISFVCGMARGADTLGLRFANEIQAKVYPFPADWSGNGKRAGFVRNEEMGRFADALLAFWDGKSRGTQHMIKYMESLGKPVTVITY